MTQTTETQISSAPRRLLVAATTRGAAEAYARREGFVPALVLTRSELLANPWRLRQAVGRAQIDEVVVHSVDWSRETAPQLAELLALLLIDLPAAVADDATGRRIPLSPARRAAAPARAAADLAHGWWRVGAEAWRAKRSPVTTPPRRQLRADRRTILAIWFGGLGSSVGGSVTHMSGILGGFRSHGYSIHLLTNAAPLPQLERVIDDVAVVPRPHRALRLTADFERVGANAAVRSAGGLLASRQAPAFVYQRHRSFLTAGLETAEAHDVPFVLEWNASETWTRAHWETPTIFSSAFDPLLARMERAVVARADLVAAVSGEAATMALEMGASPSRVEVVPNATDVVEVQAAIAGIAPDPSEAPVIGWIGSFGPWHGASVLVRAVALLPQEYSVRMIGDGAERVACEQLAASLGVADRVEFLRSLPHDESLRELARCHILASPHVPLPDRPFFGSPTKVFEYMAIGRPIVASSLDQIADVLEDGVTARLVPPADEQALALALQDVWALPDHGRALGAAAVREAARHHTWDARAAQILAALDGDHGCR